ncbi:helix-turn-helix transcriptional regulator [Streptomyces sp. NPDC053705]|uniref:helix-turn-helix domain-containing protein n=1 Tax=Streptomyces sp. NPDC053705 TaxID=3156668 RepID=UPI00344031B9
MTVEEFPQVFGKTVRAARENRMWTQTDLATRFGQVLGKDVSALAVSRIEAAQRPVPLAEVAALAQVLNLEIDPLLNPAPISLPSAELEQRAGRVRDEINELHLQEVQLMTSFASAQQQLPRVRDRKDALARELQALERVSRKDASGEQEHRETPER